MSSSATAKGGTPCDDEKRDAGDRPSDEGTGLAGRSGRGLANLQFERAWRDVCVSASQPFDTGRSGESARRLFNRCDRPRHSVGPTFQLHVIPTGTTMKDANAFTLKDDLIFRFKPFRTKGCPRVGGLRTVPGSNKGLNDVTTAPVVPNITTSRW